MGSSHECSTLPFDNLIAFLDYNGLQIDGWLRDVKMVQPLAEKWMSFGWKCPRNKWS